MSSALRWANCTPFDTKSNTYSVFSSRYKNLRYKLHPESTYRVNQQDMANLPGISFNVYGTTDLWHAILSFNGLSDPLNDIYPGLVLQIPSKTALLSVLTFVNNTQRKANRVVI